VAEVLIVSPNFPPVDAPDLHRARTIIPFLPEFGWKPIVLSVDPSATERPQEPLLFETLPAGLRAARVPALPARWARRAGFTDLGYRAFPWLLRVGNDLIRRKRPDLIYFSTTVAPAMMLGRIWKRKFGVPFVLDIQDLWASDYRLENPLLPGIKHRIATRLSFLCEAWTMRDAGGLVAVSSGYIETLCRRYPALASRPSAAIPFGAAPRDFEVLRSHPRENPFFQPGDGNVHAAYVGRGGADMAPALRVIFGALRRGLAGTPDLFGRLRLHFIGTDYATPDRARKWIEPVAREFGLLDRVHEFTGRIPYFDALQVLNDADLLIVPGSDDAQYTSSKIFPYILAGKPILGVFHRDSSVCSIVRETRAGHLVTLPVADPVAAEEDFCKAWAGVLRALPATPPTDWGAFERYSAREMARQHGLLFDRVRAQSL
jgi:glycosyltransferase involved in cell wall biosynthesis